MAMLQLCRVMAFRPCWIGPPRMHLKVPLRAVRTSNARSRQCRATHRPTTPCPPHPLSQSSTSPPLQVGRGEDPGCDAPATAPQAAEAAAAPAVHVALLACRWRWA